jgi:hypothetical protein
VSGCHDWVVAVVSPNKGVMNLLNYLAGIKQFRIEEILFSTVEFIERIWMQDAFG